MPIIFTLVLTVLESVTDNPQENRPQKNLALPFVYAILSSKQTVQYNAVLEAITNAAEEFGTTYVGIMARGK